MVPYRTPSGRKPATSVYVVGRNELSSAAKPNFGISPPSTPMGGSGEYGPDRRVVSPGRPFHFGGGGETIRWRMFDRITPVLALAAAVVVLTPLSPAAPTAGGTFRIAEPATYVASIDQALNQNAGGVFVDPSCASLMHFADKPLPAGFRIVPELAAGFPRISHDKKLYVFTLRKGLRFSTG